jgi:chromosome partitioning protein
VKTIAFVSGKGGVGKTTLAFLLGTALTRAGRQVQYHDLDPQSSLTELLKLHDVAEVPKPEFVIVDTPPRLESKEVKEAVKTADVICIPMRPSPMDYGVTASTAEVVAKLRDPGAKAMVIFNQVRRGTFWSKKFGAFDGNEFAVPVVGVSISLRECYAHALTAGWSALDDAASSELLNFALSIN